MNFTRENLSTYSRIGHIVAFIAITFLYVIAFSTKTYAIPQLEAEATSYKELPKDTSSEELPKDVSSMVSIDETVVYYCTAHTALNVRSGPGTDFDKIGKISSGEEIQVNVKANPSEEEWVDIMYDDGTVGYVSSKYISENIDDVPDPNSYSWNGAKLTRKLGRVQGPSGPETFYNLNMNGVINIMRKEGYSEADYPYWVNDDGMKMLGDYIIVAANLETHPRGSIVETSRGIGMVCDECERAKISEPYLLDLAVTW